MFTHVLVGTNDIERARRFYDAVLGTLGVGGPVEDRGRVIYRSRTGSFGLTRPLDGEPATHANGGTIGFAADGPETVAAFHAAGLANGGTAIEDPPGPRETGFGMVHLAYLRDPDGNKICAVHRAPR